MLYVVGLEQYAREPLQSASSYGHSAQMLDTVSIDSDERCPCPHTHDYHTVKSAAIPCSEGVGDKFIHFRRRKPVKVSVHICTSYSRKHHLFHFGKRYAIVIDILSESPEKGCHRVIGLDELRGAYLAGLYTDNLCRTSAYVYTNNHLMSIISIFQSII